MTRRTDSIRTRHAHGIVHGDGRGGDTLDRALLTSRQDIAGAVSAAHIDAVPPVITDEDAAERGLVISREAMAERLGITMAQLQYLSYRPHDPITPVAYVRHSNGRTKIAAYLPRADTQVLAGS